MRVLAILPLAASCYRSAPPPPPPLAPQPIHAPAPQVANADPLAFLPADADAVIAVDARALKSSAVWKQLLPAFKPKLDGLLSLFTRTCNFDPIGQVKQMSIAVRDLGGSANGVWVVRGYDKKAVIACLEASKQFDPRSITIDHDVITIGSTAVIGFPDDTTLVSVYGANATQAALTEAIDGGAPLRMTPGFPALVERLEHSQAWFVMMGSAKLLQSSTPFGSRPVAVTGALDAGTEVDAEVRLRFEQPDQATAAATLIQGQIPQLQSLIPGVDVAADDVDAVLKLHMTTLQLRMILGMIVP